MESKRQGDWVGDIGETKRGVYQARRWGARQQHGEHQVRWKDWREPAGRRQAGRDQQPLRQAFNGGTMDKDGWQEVLPKMRRDNIRNGQPGVRINRHSYHGGQARRDAPFNATQEAYRRAFNEGRCFRCLSKSHQQAQCREPLRCFKCKGLGHKSVACGERKSAIKPEVKVHLSNIVQGRSYAHVTFCERETKAKETKEEPPHTETKQTKPKQTKQKGVSMDDLWDVRPEECNVYMPYRENLRPQNADLDCMGMVVMTQGAPQGDIPGIFARRLARQFGGHTQQYEVYPGNPNEDAPFVLMVPNRVLLQQIVWHSPYTLRRGVQVGVILWNRTWNMVYNPPPFQAWLRLTNLPFHAWNTEEIKKVTTELGHLTAIMPYGRQAGHFRHITVRVNCKDPQEIPRFESYNEVEHRCRVRVDILHWREWQEGPYPLQHDHLQVEQNLLINHPPQQPDSPPAAPSSEMQQGSTSSSEGGSGGSNVVNGPRGATHARGAKTWRAKLKVMRAKMKKKHRKRKSAAKATEICEQKINETDSDKPPVENRFVLVYHKEAPVKAIVANPLLVCKENKIQICDGDTKQVLLQVKILGLQKVLMKEGFGIKCTVLSWVRMQQWNDNSDLGKINWDVLKKIWDCDRVEAGGKSLTNESNTSGGMREQQWGHGRCLLEIAQDGNFFSTGDMPINNSGQQCFCLAHQENPGMESSEVWADKEQSINGPLGCSQEDVLFMGLGETSQDREEISSSSPMITAAPHASDLEKKQELKREIRRSPRKNERKFFGKPHKEKEEKLQLIFQNRQTTIDANLAIHLVQESGTEMTDEIKGMFHAAAMQGHQVLIQGETSAAVTHLEVELMNANDSNE